MSLWRSMAVGAGLFLSATQAQADWRYCLAVSDASHKVFMSDPFVSDADNGALEAVFERGLAQTGLQHERVQCPRAESERQIQAMRVQAGSYNRDFLGRAPVDLHWAPIPGPEGRRGG